MPGTLDWVWLLPIPHRCRRVSPERGMLRHAAPGDHTYDGWNLKHVPDDGRRTGPSLPCGHRDFSGTDTLSANDTPTAPETRCRIDPRCTACAAADRRAAVPLTAPACSFIESVRPILLDI